MKIIFLLPAGTVEWSVPEDQQQTFNFQAFITNVRSSGFFLAPGIYLRHDAMIGIVNDPGALKQHSFPTVGNA